MQLKPIPAVTAATLRGLASAILNLDFTHAHAFEQTISISAEMERVAGQIVAANTRFLMSLTPEEIRSAQEGGATAYCNWCCEFVDTCSDCPECGSDEVTHDLDYHLDLAIEREEQKVVA